MYIVDFEGRKEVSREMEQCAGSFDVVVERKFPLWESRRWMAGY